MYIKCSLPPNSFPFVRSLATTFSGAGHTVNAIQLLVQEVDIDTDKGVLDLDPFAWIVPPNSYPNGYGVSRFGRTGVNTNMNAVTLNSTVMYATREEYDGGVPFCFRLHADGGLIGQTLGLDRAFWPGDEEFFFGNVNTKKVKKNHLRTVNFTLEKDDLNTSVNSTYISGSTYITEVFLLGDDNRIVGVAKPDRPIKKDETILVDFSLRSRY